MCLEKQQKTKLLCSSGEAQVMDVVKKKGSWQGLRPLLRSPRLFIYEPVCWYLLRKLILFKTDGEHIPGNSSVQEGGRKKTCSFLYYDLPLNSFTSTDRHATNEETAIKRRRTSDKDAQWQRGRQSDVFPIPCESNKGRQHGSLRRTRCSGVRQLSTTQPVPFSRINVS